MSADNWRVCPVCNLKVVEQKQSALNNVEKSYGKVTMEKFEALKEDAELMPGELEEETLKENYEIGIDLDGEFSVSYNGHCQKCGYGTKFEHSKQVPFPKGVK